MTPIVQAGIDPGVVIYLLFAVVWAVAKLAGQGKRRRQEESAPPQSDPERPRPAINDDLREMLETLTGQKLEIPQPRPQTRPEPAAPKPLPPPRSARRQTRPQKVVARATVLHAEAAPPLPYAPAIDLAVPTVTHMDTQRASAMSMTSQPVVTTGFRSSLMGSARTLTPASWAPDLKQRDVLRAAILNQIILGPPRALERLPDHS